MSINVGMVSLGCPKNQVDGEILLNLIQQDPEFALQGEPEQCDVVLINTCGFIDDAKQESIDTILEFCALKETGRLRCVIVTGCLAQRYKEEILREIPEVDGVVGIGSNAEIVSIIRRALGGEKAQSFGSEYDLPLGGGRILTTPAHYAYLKISEGCSNRCTFCAIPYIRGDFRSRPIEEVVQEAGELADFGVKELIVIAQDTTRYGEDLYGEPSLARLLRELVKLPFRWIRLMYCYPDRITDELLSIIRDSDNIVKYIDIPLQHTNREVLRRMGRKGDDRWVRSVIEQIRREVPGVFIRTTLLAGFPGETEEQFEELCRFVDDMRFERLGCFAYSQEEGTPAARLDGQLEEEEKRARAQLIMDKQTLIMGEYCQKKVGAQVEVMVDGYDPEEFCYVGRTQYDAPEIDGTVRFSSERELVPGEFVQVLVEEADDFDLYGRLIEEGGNSDESAQ